MTGRDVPVPAHRGGTVWLATAEEPLPEGPFEIPEGLLFLDLETTGLGSFPLFLVGLLSRRGPVLSVRQYLARHYAEEAGAVSLFLAEAAPATGLASYNGKSYDLPFLKARAAACGVPFACDRPHRDLLPECRKAFGAGLPDCRLATVEDRILGRPRTADIPGSEVPAVYHDYVRTGDARALARVVRHNRLDLLAMAALAAALPGTSP